MENAKTTVKFILL